MSNRIIPNFTSCVFQVVQYEDLPLYTSAAILLYYIKLTHYLIYLRPDNPGVLSVSDPMRFVEQPIQHLVATKLQKIWHIAFLHWALPQQPGSNKLYSACNSENIQLNSSNSTNKFPKTKFPNFQVKMHFLLAYLYLYS